MVEEALGSGLAIFHLPLQKHLSPLCSTLSPSRLTSVDCMIGAPLPSGLGVGFGLLMHQQEIKRVEEEGKAENVMVFISPTPSSVFLAVVSFLVAMAPVKRVLSHSCGLCLSMMIAYLHLTL